MKFNKLTIGLGALALMFTACDKAAEQEYVPAEAVPTPPAYFAFESDDEVTIDENQTEFSFPVYRANVESGYSADVDCQVVPSKSGAEVDYFQFEVANADGSKKVVPVPASGKVTIPVYFNAGEGTAMVKVTYPWDKMNDNAGVEYVFKLSAEGSDSPYFKTTADVSAIFIPWQNVVGPKGETTAKFIDMAIFSGFSLSGGDDPFEYEVTIQQNDVYKNIFRVLTPYANMHTNSSGDSFQYIGGDIVNIMYINAQDPDNVYLCDKTGKPRPLYDTYYVLSPEYGAISYWDRAAGEILSKNFEIGGKAYKSAGGAPGTYQTQEVNGVEYPNNIVFPEDHFYVAHGAAGDHVAKSNELQILFPGGKEKKAWNELGMGSYTEGLLYFNDFGEAATYQVPVEQNILTPTTYRMVNAYTSWYPEPVQREQDYPIAIDCSDEEFLMMGAQDTGNTIKIGRKTYSAYVCNAAVYYTQLLQNPLSRQEVISRGLNDTKDGNTLNLDHMFLIPVDAEGKIVSSGVFSTTDLGSTCKLVIPESTGTEPESYATASARNITKLNLGARLPLKATRTLSLQSLR